MSPKKRLLVFASGTEIGGGSGFDNLCAAVRRGDLPADIVGVVSQHPVGGVNAKAHARGVRFLRMQGPFTADAYARVVDDFRPDCIMLSGWTKRTVGLDPRITVNIHPGPLPRFGGKGMYGRRIHEAVFAAYERGEISNTEIVMHFVTDALDQGPIIFRAAVGIHDGFDNAKTLEDAVKQFEGIFAPVVLKYVLNGQIGWDGRDPRTLRLPPEWIPLTPPMGTTRREG